MFFFIFPQVGEGSYGAVYKALDRTDGMVVAVKVLDIAQDEAASADLVKEINILKQCNSKYIVAYRGSYIKDGKLWIAMEFCGAGSLSDLMAICDVVLSEDQIAAVMQQCLEGLTYLHANKKIHRDIKSGNILLTHAGECKLADFGVSAELTNTLAKRATMIGTPYFMAPEVLEQSQYDAKADIWSLAITAYELAIGQPPHADVHPMRAIFLIPNSEPPTLPEPHRFSKEFNSFLAACLKKDPAQRPSAKDLLAHPFITKSKGQREVVRLLDACREAIDQYRAMEAAEQQASRENDPAFAGKAAADPESTIVTRQTATGTFVAGQTWVNNGDATVVQHSGYDNGNDYATMVSTNGNEYATMVSRGDNDHFGTCKLNRKGADMSTMVMINGNNKPVPGSDVVNTAKGLTLFNSITVNSTVEDIERVRIELNKLYETDLKAIQEFYMKKQETLRKILEMKKKAK